MTLRRMAHLQLARLKLHDEFKRDMGLLAIAYLICIC